MERSSYGFYTKRYFMLFFYFMVAIGCGRMRLVWLWRMVPVIVMDCYSTLAYRVLYTDFYKKLRRKETCFGISFFPFLQDPNAHALYSYYKEHVPWGFVV